MTEDSAALNRRLVKRVVIIAAVAFVVLLAAIFFMLNTFVVVNVANNSGADKVTVAVVADGKQKTFGTSGLLLVPRAAESVIVSGGDNSSTIAPLHLPFFGISTVEVRLDAGKTAQQVPYAASGPICATYQADTQALLHYDCANATQLLRYDDNAATPSDVKVADLSYISNQVLPPYMGGVIGVAEVATDATAPVGVDTHPVSITATNSNGKFVYPAPDGVSREGVAGLRIFTDTNDSSNPHFIAVDAFGSIYLGTPSDDQKTVTYKFIEAPDSYNYQYNHTLCSIDGDAAYCYRGRTTRATDADAEYDAPSISKLTFADGTVETTKAPDVALLNTFYATQDGLFGTHGTALVSIKKQADTYVAKTVVDGVDSVSVDQAMYFVKDNRVYVYDGATGQARQIYSLKDATIKGLYAVDGELFVFTAAKDSDSSVSAYQVKL